MIIVIVFIGDEQCYINNITIMVLTMEDLPLDMLNEIIGRLGLLNQLNLLRVSKYWYNLPFFKTSDNISALDYKNAQKTMNIVNNIIIVRCLIKRSYSINQAAVNACKYNNVELMRLLLATRPEQSRRFSAYYFNCFQSNNKALADELMKLRCGYSLYNQMEIDGFLFEGACAGGHKALVKMLIIKSQINKYVIAEQTLTNSIRYAYEAGNSDVLELIRQLGAFTTTATRTANDIYHQMLQGIFSGGHYQLYLNVTVDCTEKQLLYWECKYAYLAFINNHEDFIRRLLLFNRPGYC